MTTDKGLYLPAGSTADGVFDLTQDQEMIALPLSGGCHVAVDGRSFKLEGRTGVFDDATDFAYLPRDSTVQLVSDEGAVISLPGAKASRRLPFRYGPVSGVPVELRGAGSSSRQVNNFATPGAFETDKLIACEVITPASNWSSYPPHKHDEASETESELEEIYYYSFRSAAPSDVKTGKAGGYQRVYGTAERPIEVLEEIADGDVVLIPHGWHGPAIAAPSHDMYYLNVMAGPAAERAWLISDDPEHGWVRQGWADQLVDPRLPFYTTSEGDTV
jgi:5-deoxy-glucuronate isomerase